MRYSDLWSGVGTVSEPDYIDDCYPLELVLWLQHQQPQGAPAERRAQPEAVPG
ncbi:hypothetical protein [Zobellella sp. An-6]|uniref:hypothetical protein n=1 Tax=Zobellella sp. An-6 TaxID=3400218 RepID=UPI004043848E